MGFGIKELGSIEIKEPRIKIKNKFLQKIFIKLFGYRTVWTLRSNGNVEIPKKTIEQHLGRKLIKINTNPGSITFTTENSQWSEDFTEEIRKEQEEK